MNKNKSIQDILNIDLMNCLTWQYDKAKVLKKLIQQKEDWYKKNYTQFWIDWVEDVFNINTANDFGLNIWGRILNIDRPTYVDEEGITQVYDTEQFRLLLKGYILLLNCNGSVPDINRYLEYIFKGRGEVFVIDKLDMAIDYVLGFYPTEKEAVVLRNQNFLPRPEGVKLSIRIISEDDNFGFEGSEMQGFDQGTFIWEFV